MKIVHGLMKGQVLQRDAHGVASAAIRGRCKGSGAVEVRVLKGARTLKGFGWKQIGIAQNGKYEAALRELPCGGPYVVELRVVGEREFDSMRVEAVFVGDVWILAGQSNMEGIGRMSAARRPHPMVRAFYMRDEWGVAEERIHHLAEAVDRVHNGYGDGPGRPAKVVLQKGRTSAIKGVGPGHAFGIEMFKRTSVPQGLIACAHGGTSMQEWSPVLRDKGGDSLYGAMLRRYEKLGQHAAGVIWYQGESDANQNEAQCYTERMQGLVTSMRRDTGQKDLPWVIAQIGRHASKEDCTPWNSIQEQQRVLPDKIRRLDVVPAVDLELDDCIHIGGEEQHLLGRRLARAADRLVHKAKGVKPAIALDRIELVSTPGFPTGSAPTAVRISFRHVAGGLISKGAPTGFSLHDENGVLLPAIYRTTLDGNTVMLHTQESRLLLKAARLSYGHGRFPYCNITDHEGMGLPVIQLLSVATHQSGSCRN